MKKSFKILALVLAVCTLITCLVACGANTTKYNFYTSLKEVSEIKQFDYSMNIGLKMDQESEYSSMMADMDMKISGVYNSATEMTMVIECKTSEMDKYIKLTDAYIIDKNIYINVKSFINAMDEITEADGELAKMYTADAEYFKVDIDEMTKDAELEGIEDIDVNTETAEAYAKMFDDMFDTFVDFLQEAIKDVNPAVIEENEGKFTMTISDKNIAQLINNLGTVLDRDFEKTIDSMIEKYGKDEKYAEGVQALRDFKEEGLEDAKEAFAEMKEFKYEEDVKFEAKFSVQLTGKKGERVFDSAFTFKANDEETDMSFSAAYKVTENKDGKEIKAPTSVLTEEDLESLGELFGGIMG